MDYAAEWITALLIVPQTARSVHEAMPSSGHASHQLSLITYPVNTKHQPNTGSLLGQRRRQWASIEPVLN